MIFTLLLPYKIFRPKEINPLQRKLNFLQAIIDDVENGDSVHESFERHHYPGLENSSIEKFFYLAFSEGLMIIPLLRELARECEFQIERERAINIEIAPTRATLKLLTYFPLLLLAAAIIGKIMPINRNLISPIPFMMITISIALQFFGRHWAERIISHVRV